MEGKGVRLFIPFDAPPLLTDKQKCDSPSAPTTNLMSAMRSLLNIAAFRSRTEPLLACQLGSAVSVLFLTRARPMECEAEELVAATSEAEEEDSLAGLLPLLLGNWK